MFFTAQNQLRALVVEDDPETRELVSLALRSRGWAVRQAATGDEALAEARSFQPDLIFLDTTIPQQSGWLVCAKLKLFGDGPAVVFMTTRAGCRLTPHASLVGVDQVLYKPFSQPDVLRVAAELAPAAAQP